MSTASVPLPNWITYGLLPLLNVVTAFLISGLVVWSIGESPLAALRLLIEGALGRGDAIGFTLFYTTSFIFTGLSVAVAFHAGLFNIGSEGQAYIGGLGAALVALALDRYVPWYVTMPFAVIGAAVFGAAWAFIPAWLQAKRGSHVVITTIMFNFIAAALMVYLLVNVLIVPGKMAPETRTFLPGGQLPKLDWLMALFGLKLGPAPFNVSFIIALVMCFLVWVLIWRTKLGYEMRTLGISPSAAIYAGIPYARTVIIAMLISGGLAGMMALNPVMGASARLQVEFVGGAGFVGIAVSLMGRSHPLGIIFAALLFGILYQGGADLSFEMPNITREMIVVIQGLVILFAGALEYMYRPAVVRIYQRLAKG
ncbi:MULTISPECIES: ABC transporter permease [Rhizobium/Agrobacterium group]|uniref:ABC transporter permease n=1 Tax=Agrobacterium tumefaciens TaxID=358 RepID=A0A4D7YZA8_AGRTU|nr:MULTISPECIES: ABC transporter permease [Rhizobium/Agrobacterium group]MBB4401040.1 simple sugar transport system permease protein [Agrobacterium radiobacter]MBB5587195.1 simple sugar transport system permease protein [Agrobacterium radiobacter]MCZ4074654.1 ABC transporter permease [Agrobacterium sp. LMR679]NTB95578.1 ABC transporter permease [Agrobacterium tumefaciens]NTC46473.1 ABC transporter permease [Agrobacterium tumefaciens]